MKKNKNQKSILSFFNAAPKKPVQESKDEESTSGSKTPDDSPIKTSKRRTARLLDSESEDDVEPIKDSPSKVEANKENKKESPVKEVKETDSEDKKVGFTEDSVPPLRLTARKNMKRKSDCLEDKQIKMVKKLKEDKSDDVEPMEVEESSPVNKKKSPKVSKKKASANYKSRDESYKNFFSKFQAPKSEETEGDGKVIKTDEAGQKSNDETKECKEEYDATTDEESDTEVIAEKKVKEELKAEKKNGKEEVSEEKEEEEMVVDSQSNKSPTKSDKSPSKSDKSPKKSPSKSEKTPKKESVKNSKRKSDGETIKDENKCNDSTNEESDAVVKTEKNADVKKSKKRVSKKKSFSKSSSKSDESSGKDSEKESSKETSEEDSPSKPSKESSENSSEETKPEKKFLINPFAPKAGAETTSSGKGYNPGKDKYHPIKDAIWAHQEEVPYLALAKTLELIEETKGRLRTVEILSNLLRSVIVLSPDNLLRTIYLCLNKVAPAFDAVELSIGESILVKAIAQTTGRAVDKIKADAKAMGDLGKVAEASKSNQRTMFQPKKLTIKGVFEKLRELALMTGNASQNKKVDKIKCMFVACRETESRFLIRSLGGKLRIGLAEQSVLQAIGQACYLTPPEQEYPHEILNAGKGMNPEALKAKFDEYSLIVKTTYCECPSYDSIVPVLFKEGVLELPKHCKLTPGVPLKPMLAHPTKGISEVFKRFEKNKFTCEYKYDGERAQIHLSEDGTINVYSRNQEDNTTKYPDIINRIKDSFGEEVKSFVMDTEAVAWDKVKERILPFQILSTRKRKDVKEEDIKVTVCVFPFDLLYFNGESLVQNTFEERRGLLREHFKEVPGQLVFAKSMDSTDVEDIEEFLDESIKGNCEGLMVKTLQVDATYEIAKRSHNWLKIKKDYLDGVGDSLDVVVLGGYAGKGKRAGQFGGFLLGCYDPENEEFQTICKIGTGFTDTYLTQHSEFFKDHFIDEPKSYYRFEATMAPDQWFDAVQVWEIKCADLSISPVHKAGAGIIDPEKGISLRFPRFLRIRDDKNPEQATSAQQVADMYNNQDQIKNANEQADPEDFY